MRKVIRTRYFGPTGKKGAKIQASDGDKHKIYLDYPHELNFEKAHEAAALKLCQKLGWNYPMVGGQFDHDYFFVFLPEEERKVA